METFTLSRKELHRPGLLKALCAGRVTTRQVANALGVSLRQTRRLRRRFEAGGAAALAHRGRGRPSPRRLAVQTRDTAIGLMTTRYVGFNDSHLTEKLREQHRLGISRESVRRLRCELGLAPRHRRRPPQARRRRVPEAARAALVQIDGSPFASLEARGPQLMLLGAIDDATSEILALHFRPAEDVHGYTTLFQQLFTTHGRPGSHRVPARVHRRFQPPLRQAPSHPAARVAAPAARFRPRAQLPLSPRRGPGQHRPRRSPLRAAARRTLLRGAHRRGSRTPRWPLRRAPRRRDPRSGARALGAVRPQAAPCSQRRSAPLAPAPGPAPCAPALGAENAHRPPPPAYAPLGPRQRPQRSPARTQDRADIFT